MASFQDIINKKQKDWNCPELMDASHVDKGGKLPFSSPLLNWATYGGIPRNRITEFFGAPGGGKSSTSVDICKNAHNIFVEEFNTKLEEYSKKSSDSKSAKLAYEELQEQGPKKVLYIDLEHSFDMHWAKTLGVNTDIIEIMQPPDIPAEEVLQAVIDLVETGEVGLVVLDSLPSLVPKTELDKNLGERTVAALAGLLTIFCRKVIPLLTRYETTLIFINQIRDNMENPYVVKTPGGNAPKFFASLRIQYQIGKPIDFLGNELPVSAENPAGYVINARIAKQKSAPYDRKMASYYLMANSGIRVDMDYAQLALKRYGLILKSGGWFSFVNPDTGELLEIDDKPVKVNGMAKVYEYLQDNLPYFNALRDYIDRQINATSEGTSDDINEIL